MSTNVGPWFHCIAALLEDDERQSVLGDIAERGATLRAWFDLAGLVALRQLQAWGSWHPWVLAVILYFPTRMAGFLTNPIVSILYSGHLLSYEGKFGTFIINPWVLPAAPAVAWAAGFALARLGGRRSASLFLMMPVVFGWTIYNLAHYTFYGRGTDNVRVFTYLGPDAVQAARLIFLESGAFAVAMLAMLLLVAVPCIRGFRRGLDARRLSVGFAIVVALLLIPEFRAISYVENYVRPGFFMALSMWPVVYAAYGALAGPKRSEVVHET